MVSLVPEEPVVVYRQREEVAWDHHLLWALAVETQIEYQHEV